MGREWATFPVAFSNSLSLNCEVWATFLAFGVPIRCLLPDPGFTLCNFAYLGPRVAQGAWVEASCLPPRWVGDGELKLICRVQECVLRDGRVCPRGGRKRISAGFDVCDIPLDQ